MSGWTRHEGLAVALDLAGIDTDQLIPARFMARPRSGGYGGFLLHDLRHDEGGAPVADFPLNRWPEASVLVTRRNFGSGSSREAAVYALVDFGIRAVVAPSFGDIFAANAVNNGLLPARLPSQRVEMMIRALRDAPAPARIDLEHRTLRIGDLRTDLALDPAWRDKLMTGRDDIDLTRDHAEAIAAFRARHAERAPWAFPARNPSR